MDSNGTAIVGLSGPEELLTETDVRVIVSILEKYIDQLRIIASLKSDYCKTENVSLTYQKTWNFVVKTVLVLKEELKNNTSYDILDEILGYESSSKSRQSLDNLKLLELDVEQLEYQFNEALSEFQRELSKHEDTIRNQSDELQEIITDNERNLEYERTWLRVQLEEDQLRHEIKEKELTQEIINLSDDIEEEKKVHSEIMKYYESEMEEVQNAISHWKDRFQDITDREDDVGELKTKQEKLHEELEAYRKHYNTRQELMDEYLADKDRRRQEYEYEQLLQEKATRIQAWWRGVMVRRFMGPFRYLLKAKSNRRRKMSLKRGKK